MDKKVDELIVMNEDFLKKLNNDIDKTIEQKKKYELDYDLLEKALKALISNQSFKKCSKIKKVIPIKR